MSKLSAQLEKRPQVIDFRVKEPLLLWAIGIIQPAAPDEILAIIERATNSQLPPDALQGIHAQCETLVTRRLIRVVNKKRTWYSLTYLGDIGMPTVLRRRRDRMRLFLLKRTYQSRISAVGAPTVRKLIDVSSITNSSEEYTQEVPRPTKSAIRGDRGVERFRWPRIFEQINGSGSAKGAPTLTSQQQANTLTFYSFSQQHRVDAENGHLLNAKELALAIGISARLIALMAKFPERFYRQFEIPKASGGARQISSPRLFLKVTQYWLKDYVLNSLPVHENCYSFLPRTSIRQNARCHENARYVATIDILDFFGSIGVDAVTKLLKRNGFTGALARIVAKLTTFNDKLPQGAPTSPSISNSILFKFDQRMTNWANSNRCSFSRYADDITVSGNDLDDVSAGIEKATHILKRYGFNLNEKKSRVQSKGGRQMVTGLTVNQFAQPTREQRRRVRAMLHQFLDGRLKSPEEIASLRGWVSYFQSFPSLAEKFRWPS